MPAGITSNDSMFSVRETPWHGLGAVLDQPPTTIAEAIEASGLGWRVAREPIAVDRGDAATVDDWWEPRCEEIPGYYATVRQDTRQVLGIVCERVRGLSPVGRYLKSVAILGVDAGSSVRRLLIIATAERWWLRSAAPAAVGVDPFDAVRRWVGER